MFFSNAKKYREANSGISFDRMEAGQLADMRIDTGEEFCPDGDQNLTGDDYFRQLRRLLHGRLIDSLEDEGESALDNNTLVREQLNAIIDEMAETRGRPFSGAERERLTREVVEELGGMGPIAVLMLDPTITDILVNGPNEIWVDRQGHLTQTELSFDDEQHLRRFLDRIVSAQGRQLDARQPMVDTRLADGSRLHAVIPPLCALGPVVSIRRFHSERLDAGRMVESGFLSKEMLTFLQTVVAAGVNIVISGSAGAGKTSLLNVISGSIPAGERIVTVEETAELRLHHKHVIPLESRYVNSEGEGAISLRDLVRQALRMRADRIVVGEVRGAEALDMLQAMNVGHDGSLTTLHANSPRDVIGRLETLSLMGETSLGRETVRQMIHTAVHLIVQVMRFRDGSRRVVSICELRADGEVCELFKFYNQGIDELGRLSGRHLATGAASRLGERIASLGFDLDAYNALLQGSID